MTIRAALAVLLTSAAGGSTPLSTAAQKLPRVVVITAGGTIAGTIATRAELQELLDTH